MFQNKKACRAQRIGFVLVACDKKGNNSTMTNHRTARPLGDFVILGIVKKMGVEIRTQCTNSVCRASTTSILEPI